MGEERASELVGLGMGGLLFWCPWKEFKGCRFKKPSASIKRFSVDTDGMAQIVLP